MGNCMGNNDTRIVAAPNNSRSEAISVSERGSSVGPRKNLPLRSEKLRWKSDRPLTLKQVLSKRDEFWDTAPAFEGSREIWDALKAAAVAVESSDINLAQAIIDGANITLPNGTLTDCFDELGTRYQLPVYCISLPINVVQNISMESDADSGLPNSLEGEDVELRVRLSTTLKDIKLNVKSTDTVNAAKEKLEMQERLGMCKQRWYYCGKMLSNKLRIHECNIKPKWVIQCILTDEALTPVET